MLLWGERVVLRRHEWDYFESLAFMMKRLYVMIDEAQPGVATYLPGGGNLHLLPQPGSSFLHLQIRQKSSCFSIEKVSWQRYPFEKIAGRTDQQQFSWTRTIAGTICRVRVVWRKHSVIPISYVLS